MTPRTNPIPRDELVAHAKRVLAGHESVARICSNRDDMKASSRYEADVMATIVAVLENYPLASPAAECVRIICDDLAERGGFREVIAQIGVSGWREIQEHIAAKLARTVVFTPPAARLTEELEIEFA